MKDKILRNIHKNSSGCWEWEGANNRGYGVIYPGRRYVHRVAYEEFIGPIPEGMLVLHKCDNPPCVNPEHLFLGTHQDNTRDMILKGRDNWAGGEFHSQCRLTDDDVRAIRRSKAWRISLASEYGVGPEYIDAIRSRRKRGQVKNL